MGIRGRQSAKSLEVVPASVVSIVRRPQPPESFSVEQVDVWRRLVNRLPADWFPAETHDILEQYCRHVVNARRVAQLIAAAEASAELDIKYYGDLLRMHEAEGRAISSLATRMRITQQTSYAKDKKRGPVITQKPWDDDED